MKDNIYENTSVKRLILYFSVPAILSLIVEILASVVDTAFAGHLGSQSVDALTAMGILTPLLNLFTSVQSLFAVSTSVFTAKYLNDKIKRDGFFVTGLLMSAIVSTTFSLIIHFSLNHVLNMLNAQGNVFFLAESYLKIQLLSNIFSSIGYTLTSIIRAYGFPEAEMKITISSVIVNILFNAILTFGFRAGFAGLAAGTLISEVICALYAFIWLKKHFLLPSSYHISMSVFIGNLKELVKLGLAETLIQSVGGCTGFFVNNSIMLHLGIAYIGIWNVVQNIYTLLLMPVVGITQAVQTIIAYFNGQGNEEKKKKTIKSTTFATVSYGIAATIFVFISGSSVLSIFLHSDELVCSAVTVLRIAFAGFSLTGIFYTIMTLFEVTGHEIRAVVMILMRQVFLMVPLVYILPYLLKGVSLSVFFAIPASDVLALFITLILLFRIKRTA